MARACTPKPSRKGQVEPRVAVKLATTEKKREWPTG